MTRYLFVFTLVFISLCSAGQTDKEVIKSIDAKGVKSVEKYPSDEGKFYYFTNKKGKRGFFDFGDKKILSYPQTNLVAFPSTNPKIWSFDSDEAWLLMGDSAFIDCSKPLSYKDFRTGKTIDKLVSPSEYGNGYKLRCGEYKWIHFIRHNDEIVVLNKTNDGKDQAIIYDLATGDMLKRSKQLIHPICKGYLSQQSVDYPYTYKFEVREGSKFKAAFKDVSGDSLNASKAQIVVGDDYVVGEELMFGHYLIQKNGKVGVLNFDSYDPRGITLPVDYDLVKPVEWMHCFVVKDGKIGMYSLETNLTLPAKYSSLEILGRSTCDQYLVADNKFYNLNTWDCEIFEGISTGDGSIYDSIKTNFPSKTYKVSGDRLLVFNGSERGYDNWDEDMGDNYWVTEYAGGSGIYNWKNKIWELPPIHFEMIFCRDNIFLSTPDSSKTSLTYSVIDTEYSAVKTYDSKIDFHDHLIYIDSTKTVFVHPECQPWALFKLNYYSWTKQGSFLVFEDWQSEYDPFDEESFYGAQTNYYCNSEGSFMLEKDFKIIQGLNEDMLVIETTVNEHLSNGEFDVNFEYSIYDSKRDAMMTEPAAVYKVHSLDSVSIGNESYNMSDLRKQLTTIPPDDLLPEERATSEYFENQEALIVKEIFVDKRGREHPNIAEYYLKFNGKQYFIKFSDGDVSLKSISDLAGQTIYFDGKIREGLWDSDDPNVQSRIGKYLSLKTIRK